jgi:hypothetical protein
MGLIHAMQSNGPLHLVDGVTILLLLQVKLVMKHQMRHVTHFFEASHCG